MGEKKKKRLGLVFLLNLLISLIVYQTVMSPKTRRPCSFVTEDSTCVWTHQVCFLSNDLNSANAPVNKCRYLWRLLLLFPPCRAPSTSAVFVAVPVGLWKPVASLHKPPLFAFLGQSGLGNTGVLLGDFNHFSALFSEIGLLKNWRANFAAEKCHLANSERTALATEKLHMSVSVLIKFCIKDNRKDSFQLISSFGKIPISYFVASSYHFNFHFLWF